MAGPGRRGWRGALHAEWRHLVTFQASDRLWQMPFAAALASGLPLMVGAWFGRMDYGMISSLGGMVFLSLPETPLHHRMAAVMACAFAMSAGYTLGLMAHLQPVFSLPAVMFVATVLTMLCRFYGIGPPGSLFFVMAAAIGAYSPVELLQLPLMVGLNFMGALLACMIGFFYSLFALRLRVPRPVPSIPEAPFDFVVFDPIVIGIFVGVSLALAQLFQMDRPYWVPVSCMAVIQAASLRAVWNRQLHRVLGTGVGLLLAWGLLVLPLGVWGVALTMMVLAFVIETLVVRNYAIATVFITPLTILLAEVATGGGTPAGLLMQARFLDTVLGSVVGLAGGACLHSPGFRRVAGGWIRKLLPVRLA